MVLVTVRRVALAALSLMGLTAGQPTLAQVGGDSPPSPGQVPLVRLFFPQDEGTLTPYTFELGYPLMTLVYDTLLWRDTDGVPQPWLARSVENSPDRRRVTVSLADGARWHDGAPVTSADVAFTVQHLKNRPHPRFTSEVSMVERVETPDASTAVFVLREPVTGFLDQPLADVPILPRHLWKDLPRSKLAPDGLPVGSGPYRLVQHTDAQRYRFDANQSYFRGPPAVSTIDVRIVGSTNDTLHALDRNEVDMAALGLSETVETEARDVSVRIAEGPSYLGTVLLFNVRVPPFDRPEVRQAVARAVDTVRVARGVGQAVPADRGMLHPESPFALHERVSLPDLAVARPVLRSLEAPITVLAPDNDPTRTEAGRLVVQALRGAGAPADLRVLPSRDLDRAVGADGSPPSFQAAIWTIPPLASYDPAFLARLFGSEAAAPYGLTGYRSPSFDSLAHRMATADGTVRTAAVEDALRLLAADVPALPLYFPTAAYAYRPSVFAGWTFIKGAGVLDKRSFVDRPPPTSPGSTPPVGVAGTDVDGNGSGLPAGTLAVGLLGVAAILTAGVALVSRRRR